MHPLLPPFASLFFFFNDTATTEIYTLSPHDALPISALAWQLCGARRVRIGCHSNPLLNPLWLRFGHAVAEQTEATRSEEHTSELQSPDHLVCRLLLEKKKMRMTSSTVNSSYVQVTSR